MRINGIVNNVGEIIKFLPEEYEVLLIDDGSKDNTWSLIKNLSAENGKIKGLRFSRNFGKEAALIAGVNNAKGDAVILIDSDLQHPPRYIPELVEKWKERL